MRRKLIILFLLFSYGMSAQVDQVIVVPSEQQLAWHDTEFYLFMHFGPNTFTGKEWGEGTEPEDLFNPATLDCRQWCRIAKASGAKGIIITAKHHDGFCLWPSKFSKHTVRESRWKNGKGDVLKELSEACREAGLKFGVYISPWDRNHPDYGTPLYNTVFKKMMKEIFQNYGPIWELWWDGANGEGPNGKKQVYDWNGFRETVTKYSPNTVVFSDVGPHIRWVGNENGIGGITNWNTLDTAGFTPGLGAPHTDTLSVGNIHGRAWIPAECDVSIRPGWFYHSDQDGKVKTPEQLFQLYLKSVGRGANLLLNVPPDRNGLIHPADSASLINFNKLRRQAFGKNFLLAARPLHMMHYAATEVPMLVDGSPDSFITLVPFDSSSTKNEALVFELREKTTINCIQLMEPIRYGQRIISFELALWSGSRVIERIRQTTVGRKRIITFPATEITSFSISLIEAKEMGAIGEVAAYLIEDKLREQPGN